MLLIEVIQRKTFYHHLYINKHIFVKNPAELEPEIQIDLNNLNFLKAEEAVWLTCHMM